MPRERTVEAFILKKQDYGEADQIITLFSKQEGKLRCLAKAVKLPTSKLQPMLQPIFQTRLTLSGHAGSPGLAKVINVQLVESYAAIFEQESKLAAWFMASELTTRAVPDGAPNELLFAELEQYASFLNQSQLSSELVKQSVTQLQVRVLATLGLGIHLVDATPDLTLAPCSVWFSLDRGGFTSADSADAIPVNAQDYQSFQALLNSPYQAVSQAALPGLAQLSGMVNRFVTYQLEREIKSQHNLAST